MPAMKPERYSFCSSVNERVGAPTGGAEWFMAENKHQPNSKLQTPNESPAHFHARLELGAWEFFGVWCLAFGVSFRFLQSHSAEFQLRLAGNGIAFAVRERVDAAIFVVQLPPMKGHEECAGANAIVQLERRLRETAPRDKPHLVPINQSERRRVSRVRTDKWRRVRLVQLRD